jgi:hypothetical protein
VFFFSTLFGFGVSITGVSTFGCSTTCGVVSTSVFCVFFCHNIIYNKINKNKGTGKLIPVSLK